MIGSLECGWILRQEQFHRRWPWRSWRPQHFFTWIHALLEVVHVQVLESGTSDGSVEIDTIKERVDFKVSLGGRRKGTLGTLAGGSRTTERTLVATHILLVPFFEVGEEIINHSIIKIFTS